MHNRPRALAPLISLALATVLAGCGSSSNNIASKSPAEILAASRATALNASSVHIVSWASLGKASFKSDFELAQNAGRARLSILGVTSDVIRIGNTLYIKGNRAFRRQLERRIGVHLPEGAWIKAPATYPKLVGLAALTNVSHVSTTLPRSPAALSKGATTTINGQRAVELKQAARLYAGTLYIATTGNPYPIWHVKHGHESGQTTYTNWNQPVTLSAPANAIELSKLQQQASATPPAATPNVKRPPARSATPATGVSIHHTATRSQTPPPSTTRTPLAARSPSSTGSHRAVHGLCALGRTRPHRPSARHTHSLEKFCATIKRAQTHPSASTAPKNPR